jgi:aryl-alcohol dehydrogenase-like predicted oxidoreductase
VTWATWATSSTASPTRTLAWLLDHSDVTLPIPGTSDVEHLRENVAAGRLSLTADELARLTAAGE